MSIPRRRASVVKITRRERAKATRRRIAEAALARFSGQGYAATTMDAIAADASIAVQTVYFTFHTKAELLIAALKIAGSRSRWAVTFPCSDWMAEVVGIRRWAASGRTDRRARQREVSRRVGPLLPAVRPGCTSIRT